MLFNSYIFLFAFLPLTLLVYWLIPASTWRLGFLILASYVFYIYWDWRYLPILIVSTSADWIAGEVISRSKNRRLRLAALLAAIAVNLGFLGYFKYTGFFLDNLNGLSAMLGTGRNLPVLRLVLPIGISFYTFNAMSYAIDLYKGTVTRAKNYVHYEAFVSMFPHLVAGPIVRYADMDQQLRRQEPRLTAGLAASGLYFFAMGMTKKLLFADLLAPYVNDLWRAHSVLGVPGGWAAALGYALQLYFDFSGYSDMAVGLAFLLGFRFPQNFDSPYKSANISEFWRRWNMSLAFWFRDYVFIPLGGSRKSLIATLRNLIIVWFLVGLWHGAAWTFIIWGLLHGVYLVVHILARRYHLTPSWTWANRLITFLAVLVGWVFFRATSVREAVNVLSAMVGLHGWAPAAAAGRVAPLFAATIALGLVWVNLVPNTWEIPMQPRIRWALVYGLLLGAAILTIATPSPFLYFQF
jgi:alginate O-acetyltransferase complex protein AlgI